MPRPKLVKTETIEAVEKPLSNHAVLTVAVDIAGVEDCFEIIVKDFCQNVSKVNQKPETILAALVCGLEQHFGRKVSFH
jgi:hypothetical protein